MGPATALLESSSYKIEMDFAVSKTEKPATSTSVNSASASTSTTKAPKFLVINHENSKFTMQVIPSTSHNDTDTKKEHKHHKQKRNAIVVSDDDDDFENLDFGDQDSLGIPVKKSRSSSTDKLVVIDDSDDNDAPGSENVYVRTGVNDLETDHTVKRSQETAVVI